MKNFIIRVKKKIENIIREIYFHYKLIVKKFILFINSYRLKKLPDFSEVTIIVRHEGMGFFAFLNYYLYITKYLESLNFYPNIILQSSNYSDESHNFDLLYNRFQPQEKMNNFSSQKKLTITITDLKEILPPNIGMSIAEASLIQKRLLVPSKTILDLVDSYIKTEIGGNFFAVHWRGTDKQTEAPPINLKQIILKIEQLLDKELITSTTCYITSDEESKVKDLKIAIEEQFRNIKVIYRSNTLRSSTSIPIFLASTNSADKVAQIGDEALFECLIFSRASCLIKTASILSGWSAIFNPELPIYFLNASYKDTTWFPESELILRQKLI